MAEQENDQSSIIVEKEQAPTIEDLNVEEAESENVKGGRAMWDLATGKGG